jgi:hypothetical protein
MKNTKRNNVNFKEMLSDTAEVTNILNSIDLSHLQVQDILSSYEKDNNRFGVIFMAKDNKTEKLQKIVIDAIDGEPNSSQMKELTYDQGSDCDKRIILYKLVTSDYTKNEFWYELEMVEGFAKVNNDCCFETFLVHVSLTSDKTYKYNAEIYPDETKWTSLNKLPTKLEFEKAVFKVVYDQTDPWDDVDFDPISDIDHWFSGTCRYLDMNGISFMFPVWDENGLFAQAESITHEGADDLRTIKDNNQKYLRKMFVNREATFELGDSGRISMSIKLWDKPLSFFTKALYGDKEKIVEKIREVAYRIDEYWNNSHYLDGSINDMVEEHLAIPEDVFNELEKEISA